MIISLWTRSKAVTFAPLIVTRIFTAS